MKQLESFIKEEIVECSHWGSSARKLKVFVKNKNHLVLESIHPSPLSAIHGGWFGNNHFKKANEFLVSKGTNPIDWSKQNTSNE